MRILKGQSTKGIVYCHRGPQYGLKNEVHVYYMCIVNYRLTVGLPWQPFEVKCKWAGIL